VEFIRSGGETEVKDVNLSQYVRQLMTADDSGNTGLRAQYQLVTSFEVKPFHFQSALSAVNEGKNRSTSVLPVELSRVHLPAKAGVEGSDYINASFLQGYTRNDEFIITQYPIEDTTADFWNMIWDQNSITIVLLSPVDDEKFKVFWPASEGATMDFGNFHVLFQGQTTDGVYTDAEFLLQSTQDDYECVVKMVSCSCWPASFSPLRNVFELIHKVKAWHAEHEQSQGPVIVVDKLGGVEASTFCALMTLYDALHHEACVDVYTVAKLYCTKRPLIFPTEDDYLFLYKAVESLCNEEEACVSGDRDSGIANCNNYSVDNHQPPASPQQPLPGSPPISPSPGSPPASPSPDSPLTSPISPTPRSSGPLTSRSAAPVSPTEVSFESASARPSSRSLSYAASTPRSPSSPGTSASPKSPLDSNMATSPKSLASDEETPQSQCPQPGGQNHNATSSSLDHHALNSIL
jgi:protein tyrosine phosphatase